MELKTYVKSLTPGQRKAYAERAGTNDAYLSQLINGHATPSPELAKALARESDWVVRPEEIHPVFEGIPRETGPKRKHGSPSESRA